jgi:excisionase family DNA binding protein
MWDQIEICGRRMRLKQSEFKSYDELPLFLNAKIVAQVLGISLAGTYELLHREDFPVVKIGSRLVVPKEEFLAWVEEQAGGRCHE